MDVGVLDYGVDAAGAIEAPQAERSWRRARNPETQLESLHVLARRFRVHDHSDNERGETPVASGG